MDFENWQRRYVRGKQKKKKNIPQERWEQICGKVGTGLEVKEWK